MALFSLVSSLNLDAKVLTEKNVMVSVDVTVPDSWVGATIKSVGDDFYVNVYLSEEDRTKTHDTSAYFTARNTFKLVTPKGAIAHKKLTPQEIEQGGQHILTPYSVIRDENPGGGYVYIVIDEFDVKPVVNAPHVALNDDDHDKNDEYDHDQVTLSEDTVPLDRQVTYGLKGEDAGEATGTLIITNHTPDLVRFYNSDNLKTDPLGDVIYIQYTDGVPETDAPTIILEGIKRTDTEKDVIITAVWAGLEAKSESGVYAIDLDVDTFNEKKFDDSANANPSDEDKLEFSDKEVTDDNKLIGKIIFPNHHYNENNLPGWVSGYDANDAETRDDAPQINGEFVPVKVKLLKPYLPDKAEVTFTYDTSHPVDDLKIDVAGDPEAFIPITYELKKRGLRLWAKKATDKRDKKSIAEGGNYIKVGETMKWTKLAEAAGGSASDTELTLYLEYAWHPGAEPYQERQPIKIEVEQAEGEEDKAPPKWKDEVWVLPLTPELIDINDHAIEGDDVTIVPYDPQQSENGSDPNLKFNSRGEQVRLLIAFLNANGANLEDGDHFNSEVESALGDYTASIGLSRRQVVNQRIWNVLKGRGWKKKNIAWIDAHISAENDNPRMPQLEFTVHGIPESVKIKAKLKVEYIRGNGHPHAGGRQTDEDKVLFPQEGFKTFTEEWKIWESYQAMTFFGGKADFTYKLSIGETDLMGDQEFEFRVGGENPDDNRCKQYIVSLPEAGANGKLWYAYGIVKAETISINGENGPVYNQFLEQPFHTNDLAKPAWGSHDGAGNPGGYGLFQVTGDKDSVKANIPREQIWHWKGNLKAGIILLEVKRKLASEWIDNQKKQAKNKAIPEHTVANITFKEGTNHTIIDAVTMKAYNGASKSSVVDNGNVPSFVLGRNGHYCVWNDNIKKWELGRFNNLNVNYVERVCKSLN